MKRSLAAFAPVVLALVGILAANVTAVSQEVLTNDSVVHMVKAGLSEPVIIAKIRSSATKFDLRTEALVSLKRAGVSDKVLETMVAQGAPATGSLSAPPVPAEPGPVPLVMPVNDRNVIYHVVGDQYVELVPSVAEIETNFAFFQSKSELVLPGRKARYRVTERQPVFLSAYSPTEAPLVRLKPGDDKDDRNLKISSGAFMPFGGTQRHGVRGEDKIAVNSEKDSRGLYRVSPAAALPPGEYGFVRTHGFAGGTSGRIFDFGVD